MMEKKRWLAKAASLGLAGALVFTGCAAPGKVARPADGKKAAGQTEEGTGRQMEGNLYLDGLPIVKEPETFTIAVVAHPLSKGTYDQKLAVVQAQKDTNIKIKWMEIPNTGWQEKINVMFASGDLPDAIATGISDSSIVGNLPQLVPIGDYLDKYAPHVAQMYKDSPELKTMLKQQDGKIYSYMTNIYSWLKGDTDGVLFINKKWLDKLGLPLPATVEEYEADLKAFKEKDPNGNGIHDEIPLSFCQQDYAARFNMLLGFFGIQDSSTHVMIENGKVVFSPAKPEYYEALKYFHKLAAEGLLDVEGFSQTQEQFYSKGHQQALGSFLEFLPYYVCGQDHDKDYVPLPPLKSGVAKPLWDGQDNLFTGNHGGFLITKACKHPEALVRWFDYCNTKFTTKMLWFWGKRGVIWDMDDATGQWWNTNNLPKGLNRDEYRYTAAAGPQAPVFITKDEVGKMINKGDDPIGKEREDCVNMLMPYFPKERLLPLFESAQVMEEKSTLQEEIDNYVKNFTAQAVLSGIDGQGWKEHLAKLDKLNVKRYLELEQQTYDRAKQ